MNNYAIGFLFSEDKSKLLLLKKISDCEMHDKLTAPGGTMDLSDCLDFRVCLSREFAEEVGLCINPQAWKYVTTLNNIDGDVQVFTWSSDYIYAATQREEEEIVIIDLNENVPENMFRNLCYLIPMCLDERIVNSKISYR